MVTLQITLPEQMLIFVEAQATGRGLAGPSEYLQALIAAAEKNQEQLELEARFAGAIRAIERGDPNPLSPDDWRRLQQRVLSRQPSSPGTSSS
ncbi:MAG TPA: hypothetical protein VKA46_37080 [Gemmataceae bacterium]|nr:hypothetical protein [Gemmataceae bacterium]